MGRGDGPGDMMHELIGALPSPYRQIVAVVVGVGFIYFMLHWGAGCFRGLHVSVPWPFSWF